MQLRNIIFIALAGLGARLDAQVAQSQTLRSPSVLAVPYLGIGSRDVTAERAKTLKLPEQVGVEVTKLDLASPAATAGIKEGDVVTLYNGQRVEGGELVRLIRDSPPGKEVKLQIYRDGVPQTVTAKIVYHAAMMYQGELVPIQPHAQPFQPSSQDVSLNRMNLVSSALSAELESLEGQLADFFGLKDGVLVRSVMHGSAAERSGLKAGDVILRVGDARVTTPADVTGRIRAGRGQSAMLTVWRDRHEVSLAISLDGVRPGEQ